MVMRRRHDWLNRFPRACLSPGPMDHFLPFFGGKFSNSLFENHFSLCQFMTCFDHCVSSMLFRLHFVFTKFELVLRILLGIHSAEKVDIDKLVFNCINGMRQFMFSK